MGFNMAHVRIWRHGVLGATTSCNSKSNLSGSQDQGSIRYMHSQMSSLVTMSGVVQVSLQGGMHALQRGKLIMQALIIPHGLIQSSIQGPDAVLRTDGPALPLHRFKLQQSH